MLSKTSIFGHEKVRSSKSLKKVDFWGQNPLFHRVFWKKLLLLFYHFKIHWAGTLRLVSNFKKRSYFLVLAKFLTIFYIYEDFYQFSRIWSLHDSRILSQINRNLMKYPNFLKFFDRTEIYHKFLAIWDLPRAITLFL